MVSSGSGDWCASVEMRVVLAIIRFLMDLLADAGHALPGELAELDILTPYGTLFRYEDLAAELAIDRRSLLNMVKTLHVLVDNRIT